MPVRALAILLTFCGTILLTTIAASAFQDVSTQENDQGTIEIPTTPLLPELYGRLPGFRVQLKADSSWSVALNSYYRAQAGLVLPLHLE